MVKWNGAMGMVERSVIKSHARDMLRGNRWTSVGAYVVYFVAVAIITGVSFGLGALFVAPVLLVGLCAFFLQNVEGKQPQIEALFAGFKRYGQSLVAMLWMYLWTFLWGLVFVIPGLIKQCAYFVTPYLVARFPNLDPREALKLSMRITDGRKMDIFVFYLSFIGWLFLSCLTCGILHFLFVGPYMETAKAGLAEALVEEALEYKRVTREELEGTIYEA